jgi:ABC-type oligopeptide transport system substrate-binding subunit
VKPKRRARWLVAIALVAALIAAGCGDDGDDTSDGGSGADSGSDSGSDSGGDAASGGELIDLGTFVGDPPEHIDPALNVTLDAYQVVNALYDGLTEIDASTDPAAPVVKPLVAESYEANDDATVWTFKIRDDAKFSNGEAITPTSFQRAWERASNPDFAGDYSYLFTFIQGGKEKLDGTAETLAGVEADDATMTLTVTLAAPYSNFDAVAGFQLFFPMPSDVDSLSDQNDWENGLMIGNGPYMLESPRTEQEIVLVRNENWAGDIFGNTSPILDKITFRTSADPDTAYNSFEAGEGDTANIPPGRAQEADDNYGTTMDVSILGSYHFEINWEDPVVGGADNKLLREAISQAINRDDINNAVYNGSRTTSTGITPEGIPGWKADLCQYCAYDEAAAQQAFDDWQAEGNSLSEPIKIQFNAGAGHEDVVQIMIDNLSAIGIDAEAEPLPTETYFTQLTDGACQICRSGWYADYPTYDNFMYDLFHSDAIGGNNHGRYSNPEFDELVNQAKATVDKDEQADLFNQAEEILLNEDVAVIPVNWYKGDYVYNDEKIANFPQTPLGLILWEQVALNG